MATVVKEIVSLERDTADLEPTNREKTAASAYLAQFYNGVENILKRISRFHNVTLPTSPTWHIDLLNRFCHPPLEPLPVLFNDSLATQLSALRKFRHVVHHGYGFQLDWERLIEGIIEYHHKPGSFFCTSSSHRGRSKAFSSSFSPMRKNRSFPSSASIIRQNKFFETLGITVCAFYQYGQQVFLKKVLNV